eukprot:983224-Amphidinium_carterae.2
MFANAVPCWHILATNKDNEFWRACAVRQSIALRWSGLCQVSMEWACEYWSCEYLCFTVSAVLQHEHLALSCCVSGASSAPPCKETMQQFSRS